MPSIKALLLREPAIEDFHFERVKMKKNDAQIEALRNHEPRTDRRTGRPSVIM